MIWTQYNPVTGEIIGWCSGDKESPGPDFVHTPEGPAIGQSHYVNLKTGKLKAYTNVEIMKKKNLPLGFTWNVQERRVEDNRTEEQRQADSLTYVLNERVKAYPPLSEFADAMYWQSQGDETKLNAYLSKVEAVKLQYPKPIA